jgi:hypothetical protein
VGTGESISVGLLNVPITVRSGVQIRIANANANGTVIADATFVSSLASGNAVFFTFSLPPAKPANQYPLTFDKINRLEMFLTPPLDDAFRASFSLVVIAPTKPGAVQQPRFSKLLITSSPMSSMGERASR